MVLSVSHYSSFLLVFLAKDAMRCNCIMISIVFGRNLDIEQNLAFVKFGKREKTLRRSHLPLGSTDTQFVLVHELQVPIVANDLLALVEREEHPCAIHVHSRAYAGSIVLDVDQFPIRSAQRPIRC